MPSFDLFEHGRPAEADLTGRFGICPPALYVRFAQWCYDRANGDQRAAQLLYWRLLHVESYDVDSAGYSSPFELFSIGDYDGDQVGWVVLAPELPADDYPWVWYLHDGASIAVLANNTPEFFARTLSHALVTQADAQADAVEAAQELGVTISPELGQSVGMFGWSKYYERGEPAPALHVDVPPGWRYVPALPSEDGVGVLAPAAEFAPGEPIDDRRVDPLDLAAEHGNAGHSATALWHLLTPRARHGTQMSHYGYWVKYTKQAYLNLGRPQLAAHVDLHE